MLTPTTRCFTLLRGFARYEERTERGAGDLVSMREMVRACLKNISEGLAAGQGGWLRCSSVTDFANMRPRRASPSTLPRSQSPLDLFFRHAPRLMTPPLE